MSERNDLQGLGGWLILVGIGITLSPFIMLFQVVPLYFEIFTSGSFEALTTESSASYIPLWGALLMSEIVYNACLVLLGFYVMFLFYTKHYLFPRFYIAMVVIVFIFTIINAWMVTLVIEDTEMFDPETTSALIRTVFVALIWIPYMLISERVKQTFVRGAIQQPANALPV